MSPSPPSSQIRFSRRWRRFAAAAASSDVRRARRADRRAARPRPPRPPPAGHLGRRGGRRAPARAEHRQHACAPTHKLADAAAQRRRDRPPRRPPRADPRHGGQGRAASATGAWRCSHRRSPSCLRPSSGSSRRESNSCSRWLPGSPIWRRPSCLRHAGTALRERQLPLRRPPGARPRRPAGRARRDLRAARPQRRRQDDHDPDRQHAPSASRTAGSRCSASTSAARRCPCGGGSATCRSSSRSRPR